MAKAKKRSLSIQTETLHSPWPPPSHPLPDKLGRCSHKGFVALFEDFGVACLDLALGLWIDRRIAQWRAVIRRALEDRKMADVLREGVNKSPI